MNLSGLHFLLTYQCTLKCDHCFTWGSPWQSGTMTVDNIHAFLHQAREVGTIERVAFEGGEPFLYYPVLLAGVRMAANLGFSVSIVTNGFWATAEPDAKEWLAPFVGILDRLSISSDILHWNEALSSQASNARSAAASLGIETGVLSTAHPLSPVSEDQARMLPSGQGRVLFRGRAAMKLAPAVPGRPWTEFTSCPFENLRDPARVHLDPLGNIHICQGITIGNLFDTPLKELTRSYDPDRHPITSPLVAGGPAELVRRYDLAIEGDFADACHLCDSARLALRGRFPAELGPDQIYGTGERA